MKVLIGGASGLVGSALVPSLEGSGHEVTRFVRPQAAGSKQIAWDPGQPLDPAKVAGFDAIIHLGGRNIFGRWTEAMKAELRSSRVGSTATLAIAVSAASPRPKVFLAA